MSIKDRLDEEPEAVDAWRPEPNQELIGTVVRVNERQGDPDQEPYQVVTVKPMNEEPVAFHAFHTVAKSQLAEHPPQVGDEIGIRYLGEEKGARFNYHNYRIVVEDAKDNQSLAATQAANQEQRDEDDSIPF